MSADDFDFSGPAHLRVTTSVSFAVALPLLIAHGALSHELLPALGLIPLAASAGIGGFLVFVSRHAHAGGRQEIVVGRDGYSGVSDEEAESVHARRPPETSGGAGPSSSATAAEAGAGGSPKAPRVLTEDYPIVVFIVDTLLAVALFAVLVLTWVSEARRRGGGRFGMLAAYGTLPIMLNGYVVSAMRTADVCSVGSRSSLLSSMSPRCDQTRLTPSPKPTTSAIHTYLSLVSLNHGLALPHVYHWAAARAGAPAECPQCAYPLHPRFPAFPWFRNTGALPKPRWPRWPRWQPRWPGWPHWRRESGTAAAVDERAPLLVDPQNDTHRYTNGEDEEAGPAALDVPDAIDVMSKKKGKTASLSAVGTSLAAPIDAPWDS